MFYFYHGTTLEAFASILQTKHIYGALNLPTDLKHHIRMGGDTNYVFTNIYADCIKDKLGPDERQGLGDVTIIIDPLVLKYRACYFNKGWRAGVDETSIAMNDNVDTVLDYICNNCRRTYTEMGFPIVSDRLYPYLATHEALIKGPIPIAFVGAVVCWPDVESTVRQLIADSGLDIKIFSLLPQMI